MTKVVGGRFEDLLLLAGGDGRWQWTTFLVGTLAGVFNAMHNLGSAFLASTPDHWCSVPGLEEGWSDDSRLKELALPRESSQGKTAFSHCLYYDRDYADPNATFFLPTPDLDSPGTSSLPPARKIACDQWTFDARDPSTVVTEWSLVCSYAGLAATVQASYMVGVLLGSMSISILADRYGRRLAFILSLAVFLVSSTSAAFASNYLVFVILRLLTAMGLCGCYISPYIVVTEITNSPKLRSFFGIIFNIPFAFGYMVLPGVAYFIRDWSSLQLAISVPGVLMLLMYWFIPESPRWLVNRERFNEALRVLRKGAALNRHPLPSDEEMLAAMRAIKKKQDVKFLDAATQRNRRNTSFLVDLCRHRKIRRLTSIVYFTWFTVAMVYYGLALNSPEMTSDRYLGFFVAGAVEVPAYLLTFAAVQWVGRKRSYCSTFLVAGIACLCVYIVPESVDWLRSTLAFFGKFSVTATFAISYLYTAEIFPTEIRTMAVGYGSVCARLGSISAPYILQLLGDYHKAIPLVTFGVLSIVSGFLSLLLPETECSNLPDSLSSFSEDGMSTTEAEHLEGEILPMENEEEKDNNNT